MFHKYVEKRNLRPEPEALRFLQAGDLPGGGIHEICVGIRLHLPYGDQGGRSLLQVVDTADRGDLTANNAGSAAIVQKAHQGAGAGKLLAASQRSIVQGDVSAADLCHCLLYTSPSPRD